MTGVCTGYERADGSVGHGGRCPIHGDHCLLCGEPETGHDEAACDEKMAGWRPTGILNGARPLVEPRP